MVFCVGKYGIETSRIVALKAQLMKIFTIHKDSKGGDRFPKLLCESQAVKRGSSVVDI